MIVTGGSLLLNVRTIQFLFVNFSWTIHPLWLVKPWYNVWLATKRPSILNWRPISQSQNSQRPLVLNWSFYIFPWICHSRRFFVILHRSHFLVQGGRRTVPTSSHIFVTFGLSITIFTRLTMICISFWWLNFVIFFLHFALFFFSLLREAAAPILQPHIRLWPLAAFPAFELILSNKFIWKWKQWSRFPEWFYLKSRNPGENVPILVATGCALLNLLYNLT